MGIREEILEYINNNNSFGTNHENSDMIPRIKAFLRSETYGEAESTAISLIDSVLKLHDKASILLPALKELHNFELARNYRYDNQRIHLIHQANVFLLGLYIYYKSSLVQNIIHQNMSDTTPCRKIIVCDRQVDYHYSGGTPLGEFLYRWRLVSTTHDLGYGASLSENDKGRILEYLNDVLNPPTHLREIKDLWNFRNINLLNLLDNLTEEAEIRRYLYSQTRKPSFGNIYYNHGIISSLILLRTVQQKLSNVQHDYDAQNHIIWDKDILLNEVMMVASAVALHDLDYDPVKLHKVCSDTRIFNLNSNPLAWLLRVSDILQEWSKPRAREFDPLKRLDEDEYDKKCLNVSLGFDEQHIYVCNFPKREEAEGKLQQFCTPSCLIQFR